MQTQFRLTLDTPVDFALRPGFIKTQNAADFRADTIAPVNTFQDPKTGIVMLNPSVASRDFTNDFRGLEQWDHDEGSWRNIARASLPAGFAANFMASCRAAGVSQLVAQLYAVYLVAVNANTGDNLVWALTSKFTLPADGAFALHHHFFGDENDRKDNLFGVQWADILIHFNSYGLVRVFQYGSDMTQPPTLIDQFYLSTAGDMHNRSGYFWFIPIPSVGLMIYSSANSHITTTQGGNAQSGAVRGHMVKIHRAASSPRSLLAASTVAIAVNPYQSYSLGYQDITFPASGTFTDAAFDPGIRPPVAPTVQAVTLATAQNTVTGTLLKADGSAPWNPAGVGAEERQGRVQLTLSTSDNRYTPFVQGYQVSWPKFAQPRTATPLVIGWTSDGPDRMTRLEFSDDEYARFEGTAELIIGSAAGRKIVERGDATFLLEKSFDGGATWATHAGGLLRVSHPLRLQYAGGFYYEVNVTLRDYWARLAEIDQTKQLAFDGLSIGDAINGMLDVSGFDGIADLPADATAVKLPPGTGGQQFQFAPRVGDSGEKILQSFLSFLRRRDYTTGEDIEYRLRYDWPTHAWVLERKPHMTANAWTLTAFADEENLAANWLRFETLDVEVNPPEFNILNVIGITGSGPTEAYQVLIDPLVNKASLTDSSSPDYFGRCVMSEWHLEALSTEPHLAAMAARINDAAGHRRLQPKTTTPYFVDALGPLAYITIRAAGSDGTRGPWFSERFWVKKRSYIVEQDSMETMTLEMDDIWLGGLEI